MQDLTERREHQRDTIRLEATAVMGDGLIRQHLTVVNLSQSGAMVELPHTVELAEDFTLLFQHKIEECRLVWRQARFAGVQFQTLLD